MSWNDDDELTAVESMYDEVAVEPSVRFDTEQWDHDDWWDVYVPPGHFWDAWPTLAVVELHERGQVDVLDRATGNPWQADYYRTTSGTGPAPVHHTPANAGAGHIHVVGFLRGVWSAVSGAGLRARCGATLPAGHEPDRSAPLCPACLRKVGMKGAEL